MLDIIIKEHSDKMDKLLEEYSFLNKKLDLLMATLAELNSSLQALNDEVAKIPAPGTGAPSVLESDLDPIKAGIDQATANIAAKLPA
jgi:hypothetical protein